MIQQPAEGVSDEDETVQLLDWKDSPETVLEHVDHLLKPFGLEIVQFETNADHYLFRIQKRT